MNENGVFTGEFTIFGAWGIERKVTLDPLLTTAKLPLAGPEGIAGSYGLNGYCLNMSDKKNWRGPNVKGPTNNIPVFLDALRFDGWPVETEGPANDAYAAWTGDSMGRFCINRHKGFVNCLFLDTSTRKVGLKELWTLKWSRTFNTAGPWTKAGNPNIVWPSWISGYPDY